MSDLENQTIELGGIIEALLFVSSEPVSPLHLSTVIGLPVEDINHALLSLENTLRFRGLRIQRFSGRIQLTTAPESAVYVEKFLGLEVINRLSRAAIETLGIIAYKQPVTRPFIESVRGVASDGVIKSLLGKNLIQELGRTDGPGRPILYGTTGDFLQYFGINNLSELPPFDMSENVSENGPENMLKG